MIKSRLFFLVVLGLLTHLTFAQEPNTATSAAMKANAAASAAKEPASRRVVLKVGDVEVTQSDFEAWINTLELKKDADDNPDRQALGDNYASVLMLSQQAIAEHLDASPEVQRQLEMTRLQALSNAEFELLKQRATPTPEQISDYYNEHIADFEVVLLQRVFIWKRRAGANHVMTADEVKARLDSIRKAIASKTPQQVAARFSKDKDVRIDAEPLTFTRADVSGQMQKVAFALKPGEWGVVEDTPDRLLTVHMVNKGRQNLSTVSSLITQRLQNKNLKATLEKLKKNSGVWMDKKYFETAAAPVPGAHMPDSGPSPQQESKEDKQNEH